MERSKIVLVLVVVHVLDSFVALGISLWLVYGLSVRATANRAPRTEDEDDDEYEDEWCGPATPRS